MLNYTHEFGADFILSVSKVEENLTKNQKTVWVSVKNNGTLMDIGKVEMFVDGKKQAMPFIMNWEPEKKN